MAKLLQQHYIYIYIYMLSHDTLTQPSKMNIGEKMLDGVHYPSL